MAAISLSNPSSPRRPKSILFSKSIASSINRAGSDHSSDKIQATGTMREAFPPSQPSGSPNLGKHSTATATVTAAATTTNQTQQQRKIITQQSCHQLETPKVRSVNTIISGNSPSKKDNFIDTQLQLQKLRKTTTTKFGHQSPHHRNSSPNTKYNFSTGSPTIKSDLKTHLERDSSGFSGLNTTTSAVATSNSTPPSVLALADTTADGKCKNHFLFFQFFFH